MSWIPPNGKRPRGRPRNTWRRTFANDLKLMGISKEEGEVEAAVETVRRPMCPTAHEELSLNSAASVPKDCQFAGCNYNVTRLKEYHVDKRPERVLGKSCSKTLHSTCSKQHYIKMAPQIYDG
ncbi:hypothetical protein Y032_0602g521 [Ancylostoma ceylanicum]|uniref:Uncharacterized protein n=1 Tax=Ancylostoma ceylanicum TaxID=53326 RepID=A0A016WLI5_9BILA|nr:hypothetical protein Y032_0602g521 [Ancylostoma ceylanicum]